MKTCKPTIKICNTRRTIWDAKVFNKKQSETFLHFDSHSSSSNMKLKSSSRCRNNNDKCHKEGRHFSSTAPNDESQDPGAQEVLLVLVLVLVPARVLVLVVLDRQLCGDKFLGARQSWPKRMWIWPTPTATATAIAMAMGMGMGVASRAASKMDTMASIDGPQRPETDGKPPGRMQKAFRSAKGCKKA